jgi:hypothetical protein
VQAANARALSGGGSPATVLVTATGGTAPFKFSESTLELQPGVALTSDAPTSAAGPPASLPYVLEVSGAPGVKLHEGATLSGLQLQPAADGTVTDAIVTACASGTAQAAVVRDARVLGTNPSGGPRFETGVHQTGGCALTVERTLLEGNGKGVLVEASAATTVRIDACEVRGSRDVGIYFAEVPPAVDAHVTRTNVHQNCAAIDAFVPGGTRRGGGILFTTQLPTLEFRGNRVADNQGDQVLVASTGEFPAFTLTGDGTADLGSCPAPQDANHFTCRDASGSFVAVYSSGASVQALGNFWRNVPPILGQDYSGPVKPRDPIESGGQFCGQDTACEGTPASCP